MDVKQQLQPQDVHKDRGEVTTGSKDVELEEHIEDLARNSSLTTVCSTFPLTSRIESYHHWQPMDVSSGQEDILGRELKMGSERLVQPVMSIPLALNAIHP
ncbi:uncharacterized protein LOC6549868 [Drosophila erecta]|uniref:Uncharacterized protein n=1 Tax=Drosophila erecta TaxID=7220 RepID=B3NY55_DROER|nr:uncharacterized protein LOC6549868 [Drosophila erecta]EDV47576.1 uncharacterized protein Dere_GG19702 [Drosophila erecta]